MDTVHRVLGSWRLSACPWGVLLLSLTLPSCLLDRTGATSLDAPSDASQDGGVFDGNVPETSSFDSGVADTNVADAVGDVTFDSTDGHLSEAATLCGGQTCGANMKCTKDVCVCLDHYVADTGKNACRLPESCHELKMQEKAAQSGEYDINPEGNTTGQPVHVHCDMQSDEGVGYTMVKFEDGELKDQQGAYKKYCAKYGMGVIVPRSLAHGLSIKAEFGAAMNLVGVRAKQNNSSYLSQWIGSCKDGDCTFFMSMNAYLECYPDDNPHPLGGNTEGTLLYREGVALDDKCSMGGGWRGNTNTVANPGHVICSTNDVGPRFPRVSCKAYMDTKSIWNTTWGPVSGLYPIALDTSGDGKYDKTVRLQCYNRGNGGGWTRVFLANSLAQDTYDQMLLSFHHLDDLATSGSTASSTGSNAKARSGWVALAPSPGGIPYEKMLVEGYEKGERTFLSKVIPKSEFRLPFGKDGYYLWASQTGSYYWCGGTKSYTDQRNGQENRPPGAPKGCKGHTNLGSGWDFSDSRAANQNISVCGSDGAFGLFVQGHRYFKDTRGGAVTIFVR